MSYVDDWFSTASVSRLRLEEVCSNPACSHLRYQHGATRVTRVEGTAYAREVTNTPGRCTNCRCTVFREPNAITEEDVIDAHEMLKAVSTLTDLATLTG